MRTVVLAILACILFALKVLYWVYIWQLKEYRFDRMWDFARSESGKKKLWKNISTALDVLLLGLVVIALSISVLAEVAVDVWIGIVVVQIVHYVRTRAQFKPTFTLKAIGLIGASLLLVCVSLIWAEHYVVVMLVPVLAVGVVKIFVLALVPFSVWGKRKIIAQAKQKLLSMPKKPLVIGITGSYGKSTTKEFLYTLLSQQFRVLATPKHVNVDVGVAHMILSSLTPEIEICIVEMGAYTGGEIDSICSLVHPDIGILTAVSDQHLSLFGSVKEIQHAKGELVRSLPKTGLLVVNADSEKAVEAGILWSQAPVLTYSSSSHASVYADKIMVAAQSVTAEYHGVQHTIHIDAPLHGKHLLSNLVAAIAVAEHCGVTPVHISAGIRDIATLQGTMNTVEAPTGAVVIDDHYNSNPEGFSAALEYMRVYADKKKILVTPGMIELGAHTAERHQEVGKRIGEVVDVCIITKADNAQDIIAGIQESGGAPDVRVLTTPAEVTAFLKQTTSVDCILLEGRVHSSISTWALGSRI